MSSWVVERNNNQLSLYLRRSLGADFSPLVTPSSFLYSGSTTASCTPIKLGYTFDPTVRPAWFRLLPCSRAHIPSPFLLKILGVTVLSDSKAKKVMPALTGALVLVVVCASRPPSPTLWPRRIKPPF